MDRRTLATMLADYKRGARSFEDDLLERLSHLPYADLEFAKVDHHRAVRTAIPEVIFAEGKKPEEVVSIAHAMFHRGGKFLITRATEELHRDLNGCTTGVEAYVLRVPAVSYRAAVNDTYDYVFYRLPNLVSHQCFTFEELCATLGKILAVELGPANGDERRALIDRHLAGLKGPMACERIVDVIEEIAERGAQVAEPAPLNQVERWLVTRGLRVARRHISRIPGAHNKPEFQRHRYPGASLEELQGRLARFQQLLGDRKDLKIEEILALPPIKQENPRQVPFTSNSENRLDGFRIDDRNSHRVYYRMCH